MFQVQGQYTDFEIMKSGQILQQVLRMKPCLLSVIPTMIPQPPMIRKNVVISLLVYVART
jgi:hypothetical protein